MQAIQPQDFFSSVFPDCRNVCRFAGSPQETHEVFGDKDWIGSIAVLIVVLTGFPHFGLRIGCSLMAHLSHCVCQCGLESILIKCFLTDNEGTAWKGASEASLCPNDRFVEGRKLEGLKANITADLSDNDTGILGFDV